MAELSTKQYEAMLTGLRNLNSLTRLVQDIDPFTASRDLKNIRKAIANVQSSIDEITGLFDYAKHYNTSKKG